MAKKTSKTLPSYTVIRDTREQTGWHFPQAGLCAGTLVKGLKTGDYSLVGLENKFAIERKRNTGEIAMNITQSRFERELERLREFEWPFLIFEFSYDDIVRFPLNSGIPRSKWKTLRISAKFLEKRITEIQVKHHLPIIFAGNHARAAAEALFKRVAECKPNQDS